MSASISRLPMALTVGRGVPISLARSASLDGAQMQQDLEEIDGSVDSVLALRRRCALL
jgi:hypothetical protein